MGAKSEAIGGGPAVGLADNYVNVLQSLLNGGGIGTAGSPDAIGTTNDIAGVLRSILAGEKGGPGSAIVQMLSKQQTRDTNAIRSRFGANGGAAFGTPAAYAESLYRAEAAPQITSAITDLQLKAFLPLLNQIGGLSQLGIPQRQMIQKRSGFAQALGTLAQIGGSALPFINPAFALPRAASGGGGSVQGFTDAPAYG